MEILGVLHNLASNDDLSSFNKEFSKNQDVDNNVEKKYYLCVPTKKILFMCSNTSSLLPQKTGKTKERGWRRNGMKIESNKREY